MTSDADLPKRRTNIWVWLHVALTVAGIAVPLVYASRYEGPFVDWAPATLALVWGVVWSVPWVYRDRKLSVLVGTLLLIATVAVLDDFYCCGPDDPATDKEATQPGLPVALFLVGCVGVLVDRALTAWQDRSDRGSSKV